MRYQRPFVITRRAALTAMVGAGLASLAWAQDSIPAPNPPAKPRRPQAGAAWIAPRRHGSTLARNSLPYQLQLKNIGGSDGLGLCVFTSIAHTARYQGIEMLEDLQEWMRSRPGGGYPAKVDQMLRDKLGRNHHLEYLHFFGPDSYDLIQRACSVGLMPCVTLGFSERYKDQSGRYLFINHMVNVVHADAEQTVILDNNFVGDEHYEWMPADEFMSRYMAEADARGQFVQGTGWAMIFFDGEPQPPEPWETMDWRPAS